MSYVPQYNIDNLLHNLTDITSSTHKDPHNPHAIGCGTGGDVYRAIYRWADDRGQRHEIKVVVKMFRSNDHQKSSIEQRMRREVAVWRYLDHPNVAKFLGIAHLEPGRPPGVVSPYMEQNNILAYLAQHPEVLHKKTLEIAAGLEYLHDQSGIIHGDLKAANIMITDQGLAIISDFGISRIIDVEGFTTKVLRNVRHNAPELMPIQEVPDQAVVPTKQSDIFGFGILLLQLCHASGGVDIDALPYNHIRLQSAPGRELRLLRLIHAGERPQRERYRNISDDYWEIMQWCWKGVAALRPTIKQVTISLQGAHTYVVVI